MWQHLQRSTTDVYNIRFVEQLCLSKELSNVTAHLLPLCWRHEARQTESELSMFSVV